MRIRGVKTASRISLQQPLLSSSLKWTLCVTGYFSFFHSFFKASVASRLTLSLLDIFQALFVKVVPYQCLGCVWSQRDKKENMSPTIRATITQFNTVTNRVIMSLLSQSVEPASGASCLPPTTAAQRARVIEKWIKVAQVSGGALDVS